MTPELRLLLRALGGAAGPTPAPIDVDALLALAERHGVASLLAAAAPGLGLPSSALARLRELRLRGAAAALTRQEDLRRVVAELERAGVPALPFKGPTLAAWLYDEPGLRPAGDLDLLVARRDVLRARAALLALGYAPRQQPPEALLTPYLRVGTELAFVAPGRADVDLHWRLGGPEFPIRLPFADLLARAREVALGAARLRTFGAEDLLLYLCAHGGKHGWDRLFWLVDVARLVARTPNLDWDAVRARARAAGLSRLLHLGLRLAREHLGAALPPAVGADVDADAAAADLAGRVVGWWEGGADGVGPRLAFAVRGRDRARDRARVVLGAVFLPTAHEWEAVEVPPALYPLYAVGRPARLAVKYARRLLGRD